MTGFAELHRPAAASTGRPVVLLHGGIVANWMWQPQLEALSDRLVLTPDLPGFGGRVEETWPGLDAVADDVIARLAAHGIEGRFDLAGLSLGGAVAIRLLARHPNRIDAAFVTSAPLVPAGPLVRSAARMQLALWNTPLFWRAQAKAFGLPADSHRTFVEHGLSIRRETATAMFAEVKAGQMPTGLERFDGRLLAVAGERDSASIRRSLRMVASALPAAELRLAPGMHHIWNIEDTELFSTSLRSWLDGHIERRLMPAR